MKVYAIPQAEGPVRGDFVAMDGDPAARIPLTVGALLVDHPRGKVLVDAGLPDKPGLLDRVAGFALTRSLAAQVRSLPGALAEHGIDTDEVTDVVLTHLHWDHTGATPSFGRARVLVGPGEMAAARRKDRSALSYLGARRVLSHGAAEPTFHDFELGGRAFPVAHDLFGDGAIVMFPTPGHTPGSLSVLIRTDPPLLHIGDAAYTVGNLEKGVTNGRLLGLPVDRDPTAARRTLDAIGELAERTGARLLPAHDTKAWAALGSLPFAVS